MNQIDVIAWAKRAAEAARKCHEWMQGEFSDSDFDRDGKLSEADAAAFTVAYDADKAIAAIAALHSQAQEREGWVLVNKEELQAALENVKVPKMSPLKQELFKAGTHAVIRAFNTVIFKAAAPTGGSET